jgi:hypothetical protein
MMRRIGVTLLLALQFTLMPKLVSATNGDECGLESCPTTLPDGYRYAYANGVFYGSAGAGSGVVNGVRLEFFYEYACSGNETLDANGVGAGHMCAAAATTCPPGQIRMWTFTRPAGSTAPPRRQPGGRCLGVPQTVTLADAQAAFIRYLKDTHLPRPTIITAPPTAGLVNLPQIFATPDHPPVTLAVTVPLPARLTAEAHYTWDYGDGASGPDTPGIPFQPGILPADHPDYYLTHTYRINQTVTATLTVTWHAGFTVTGIAGTFPIPDITLTTTHTLPIHQARSQLVADP